MPRTRVSALEIPGAPRQEGMVSSMTTRGSPAVVPHPSSVMDTVLDGAISKAEKVKMFPAFR